MCSLCGLFGSDDHWSSQLGNREESVSSAKRRSERNRKVDIVNKFLARSRNRLRDWQGQSYVLESPTGKSIVVDNLAEIWLAIDQEFGQTFDPLDETEISYFSNIH